MASGKRVLEIFLGEKPGADVLAELLSRCHVAGVVYADDGAQPAEVLAVGFYPLGLFRIDFRQHASARGSRGGVRARVRFAAGGFYHAGLERRIDVEWPRTGVAILEIAG